jgi:hypothetical protein
VLGPSGADLDPARLAPSAPSAASAPSEYDELFTAPDEEELRTVETVRRAFRAAASPYLARSLPWFSWGLLLPAAALSTPLAISAGREAGAIVLWSSTILLGGAIEGLTILRQQRRRSRTSLGAWAMRSQGNLSLVAALLSGLLFWIDAARYLPALWLLLLGHNLFSLGGLAFPTMRHAGLVYQIGGVAALAPGLRPLWAMAAATALGNFWIGWGILRERADAGPDGLAGSPGSAGAGASARQAGEEPERDAS